MSDVNELFARLGKHERVVIGDLLVRIDRKLARRDAMADWLITLLEPRIRKIIQEELNK